MSTRRQETHVAPLRVRLQLGIGSLISSFALNLGAQDVHESALGVIEKPSPSVAPAEDVRPRESSETTVADHARLLAMSHEFLDAVYRKKGDEAWLVKHRGRLYDVKLVYGEVLRNTDQQQLVIAATGRPRGFADGRYSRNFFQVFYLERGSTDGPFREIARSARMLVGYAYSPPIVDKTIEMAPGRHVLIAVTTETWQGASQSYYELYARDRAAARVSTVGRFGLLSGVCASGMKMKDCWTAELDIKPIQSPRDASPTCAPLEITTREMNQDGKTLKTRRDLVKCQKDGTYPTAKKFRGPFV